MERMLTEENFIRAERLLGVNKRDNRKARYISHNADRYGKALLQEVLNGYEWHKPRQKTITDTYKGKTRGLKIPCLKDQAVQLAWLNIATPYILKRNYYYNCGSVPNAGQTRCVKALKRWLRNPKRKYGAVTDIKKFYDTCPHELIRKGLNRIFKDKEFVEFAMGFVASMSDEDYSIAIGYPSSHWLANVALSELDHEMRRLFPRTKYTRYMDDMALVGTNKRELRKAVKHIFQTIERYGMKLKKWAVFRIKGRGLAFLSYRFFNGYALLIKGLMVRIARRMLKASKNMNLHTACGVMSYFGILSHCNSYNFRVRCVYPYVTKRACSRIISEHQRRANERSDRLRNERYKGNLGETLQCTA